MIRSRDHAIPLYNDAREAMGLSRATKWSDITNDTEVQQRLFNTYSNIDKVEAFFGGLAEDHINGSDFGELFYKSFYDQVKRMWMKVLFIFFLLNSCILMKNKNSFVRV